MDVKGFDWDEDNTGKNWKKHEVTDRECEEVFFDPRPLVYHDKSRSAKEDRYYLLGSTFAKRRLFIVYTLRGEKIRVISARNMNKKEKRGYEKREKDTPLQE
jgi:uncharacterized DUF497 family protein